MAMAPYVRHLELGVKPDRLELWRALARNTLSVMARQDGLLSMRVYRQWRDSTESPEAAPAEDGASPRFISIAVWRSRDDCSRALASQEVELATDIATERELRDGPVIERELELIDHVWGRKGPRAFLWPTEDGFANHLFTHVPAHKRHAWDPYRRNFASVMARQNGVTSYEAFQDLHDPEIVLVLRNYERRSFASIMKGASATYQPNREVDYATRPARELDLYRDARPVVYTDCVPWDGVVGTNGIALYQELTESLEPL
jgi:quinol monooxygenase YgiN